MSVLVDTNILLRRIQPDHAQHALAIDSVARLLASGELVYFTWQNISEFWNVMTRPITANGLGFSPAFAMRCEFRRKPAGDSDLIPARVPI
jgi:predicted nucleic acid-binding protein